MLGVVCCVPKSRNTRPVQDTLLGLPVWRLELGTQGTFARWRIARGGRRLAALGTRRVLLPEDFAYGDLLEQSDLLPIEPGGLYAALAGPLTLAALRKRGEESDRAWVTLCAPRADDALTRAACFLCPRVKRLSLRLDRDGTALAGRLYREFGAAVELTGEEGGLRVCFSGTDDPTALDVRRPEVLLPKLALRVPGLELPDAWPPACVLTALWQSGRLSAQRIEVCCPDKINPLTDANTGTIM